MMRLAAGALRWRQLPVGPPRKQPRLHVLMGNVVPRPDLPLSVADLREHFFLIGNIGFDSIGDEKIRAAPGNLGQPGQPPLGVWLQTNAERCATCVRHEHTLSRDSSICVLTDPYVGTVLGPLALAAVLRLVGFDEIADALRIGFAVSV